MERFHGNAVQAVGGYNGGPNAMARWSQANPMIHQDPDSFIESIPYDQTRDYIKAVFTHHWMYQRLYQQKTG
jgi:soluble lytic murein transglycosylase